MLALLQRHGWNATSFQVLEQGFSYWFDPDGDGCVAYVETGGAWVAAGAPICAPERLGLVAERFVAAAAAARRRAVFFGTEPRFHDRAPGFSSLLIGEQPVWDPRGWEQTLREGKSLREQLRRARAKGVTVRRLTAAEAEGPERPRLEALVERWLKRKSMAPMGFLVQLELFPFSAERRFWVAEREGTLISLLVAVPVYARNGWFLEDLLRDTKAPNGTAELLVDAAMRELAASGSGYVTLGLAPLAGAIPPWMRAARDLGSSLYDFEGVRAFKARLRPRDWEPIFLAFPRKRSAAFAMLDSLRAFAQGGLLRFGIGTLLKGPSVVVRLLASLLVPWTLALALFAPADWFPAPWVRWAWVGFDLGLFAGLWALTERWRHSLATAMAALVTLDAAVTLGEVLLYNLPRSHGPFEWVVIATAVIGPALSAGLLWVGRAHRSALRERTS